MISVGIHINKVGFFVVESSFHKDSLEIKGCHSQFFAPDSLKKEIVLFEYLQSLEEKYKNQPLRFCYHLPQSEVSNFSISLPFKEKFKILKTLPFEIEEKSPFSSKKVFYDARVSSIQNNSSKVVCFVTPENNVKDFLKRTKSLKNNPHLLSVEGAALANIVEDWKTHQLKKSKNQIYVYMGFGETTALFFNQGQLENVANIDWSLIPIIKQIEKKYKLSFQQAIDEFLEKSFVLCSDKDYKKDQVEFSNLIKKELQSLVQQLDLLNLSYNDDQTVVLDECLLFGPGAAIKNISAFLSTTSSYKFSKFKAEPHLGDLNLNNSKNQSLLVPLGLSLESFKRPPYTSVNFLHSIKKDTSLKFFNQWKTAFVTFGIALCLFFVFSFVRYQEAKSLSSKMEDIFIDYGRKIMFKRAGDVNIKTAEEYIDNKLKFKKLEKVIKAKTDKKSVMSQLADINQAIQLKTQWDLEITSLEIKDANVSIGGFIEKDYESQLRKNLETFSKSKITNLKPQSNNKTMPEAPDNKDNAKSIVPTKDSKTEADLKNKGLKDRYIENPTKIEFSYKFKIKGRR